MVGPQDVFYDLGANRGIFSRLARELGACVVAFEPLPSACTVLGDVLGDDARHIIVNAAAWNEFIPLVIMLNAESGRCEVGETIHDDHGEPCHGPSDGCHASTVYTVGLPLDDFTAGEGVPLPTVIKSDTQGSEVRWLLGAEETVKSCKAMILESCAPMLQANGNTEAELLALVTAYGFRLTERVDNDLLVERV